jgi:hypothetical protein
MTWSSTSSNVTFAVDVDGVAATSSSLLEVELVQVLQNFFSSSLTVGQNWLECFSLAQFCRPISKKIASKVKTYLK